MLKCKYECKKRPMDGVWYINFNKKVPYNWNIVPTRVSVLYQHRNKIYTLKLAQGEEIFHQNLWMHLIWNFPINISNDNILSWGQQHLTWLCILWSEAINSLAQIFNNIEFIMIRMYKPSKLKKKKQKAAKIINV